MGLHDYKGPADTPLPGNHRPSFQRLIYPILIIFGLTWWTSCSFHTKPSTLKFHSADYLHLGQHCENVSAIGIDEYSQRQIKLAQSLHALGAVAYIAEPGANTQFFGNFSKTQWKLSERPLLLIISPEISESLDSSATEIRPRVTVLTPKVLF